jgi:hypothetical protein
MFKSVSHRACLCKNRGVQSLAQEFISAVGKGGMTHNVPGLAKCEYSVIRQPGTVVDFLFRVQDKFF